jgi:hypothetical protein
MKQVLMALIISAFAYTTAQAQATCPPVAAKKKSAVKHKSVAKTTRKTTTSVTACRMVPFQVCTILQDRRSVSCYTTTDSTEQTKTGTTTFFGPTGPMPGKTVQLKGRTVIIKGQKKGAYCKRNAADDATICYQPGLYLVRDENGYYSYRDALEGEETVSVSTK